MTDSRPRTRASVADGQWPPQLTALGARIHELRQKQGITHGDLAERANVSRPTISKIERGVQNVGTVALLRSSARRAGYVMVLDEISNFVDRTLRIA